MPKFIHHPVFAAIMTLIVAQQWFSLGMRVHDGWSGLLIFHLVLAPIATICVIAYHHTSRTAAYYDGKVDGIDEALNPTYWRPRV